MALHNLNLLPYFLLPLISLLSNHIPPAQALTAPSDISALKAFKASIKASSIPPWSCLASWDFTTDPCALPRRTHFTCGLTLTGVETPKPAGNGGGGLVAVDLGFNRIEGYPPVNFAGYPVLSSLSLRYNRLRGRIPLEYGRKKSLKRLYLDGNFLIGQPPTGLVTGDVSGSLGDNCLQ
ncbi:uncharacterized protein LOC110762167, partial [Prunus avium]|uniref:Uncharacterized protein LOC110762167 n=1 Tax=Prunus avium TaxID=42229 RepID=A0A6P5T252_PRUAV